MCADQLLQGLADQTSLEIFGKAGKSEGRGVSANAIRGARRNLCWVPCGLERRVWLAGANVLGARAMLFSWSRVRLPRNIFFTMDIADFAIAR